MKIRVGFGFDVHQLREKEEFWLGGILVPHSKGAFGHSDADVLIHVVCDAILGAANMRDIGFHFPDTSADYKGIDSKKLLTEVIRLVSEKGWKIGNVDSTICLQLPKVNPHIPAMKTVLAKILQISEQDISIKATTNEKISFIGRGEGIAAESIVQIKNV